MNAPIFPLFEDVSEQWARAITSLVRLQWRLLDAQYRMVIELLDAGSAEPDAASALQALERRALERARYADDEAEVEYEPRGQ